MKLALFLLALNSYALAQTPTPVPAPSATPAQAPAPSQTPNPSVPVAKPATPPPANLMVPPPSAAMPKPEDHNGPAYKNPKSTLTKVAGIPHVLYSLKYIDTKIGTGPLAEPHKFYSVNYTGWFTDGTKFDSSFDHTPKEPITFPYGAQKVIIGWDTGFEGMRVGGKRRLYVPYQLAYGLLGRAPRMAPKANLIFDVELVSQSDRPPAQPGRPGQPPPGARPGMPGMPGGFRPTPPAPTPGGTPTVPPPASTAPTANPAAPASVPPAETKPPTQ